MNANSITKFGCALTLATLLSSCGSIIDQHAKLQTSLPPAAPPSENLEIRPYEISPLDKLQVKIAGVQDLSGQYQVEPDGSIDFPLLGHIIVAGKSTSELSATLATEYGSRYLQNPKVSVQLLEISGQIVTIEGAVNAPTQFNISSPTSLLQAIAQGKGLGELANEKRVVVLRKSGGKTLAAAFNLREINAGLREDPVIYGGDTIVVDGSNLKKGWRDFLQAVPILGFYKTIF